MLLRHCNTLTFTAVAHGHAPFALEDGRRMTERVAALLLLFLCQVLDELGHELVGGEGISIEVPHSS